MNLTKILLIIEREYLTRVRKKSFIVMSLLGPLLIASIYAIPIALVVFGGEEKTIAVLDESGLFTDKFEGVEKVKFTFVSGTSLDQAKGELKGSRNDALLYIPRLNLSDPSGIVIFSEKGVSASLESSIRRTIQRTIQDIRLGELGIDKQAIESTKTDVTITTISLKETGEQASSTLAATGLGMFGGILIYMFTFLYGAQVMRGVIEEKTNRIVEVIVSSVRPFELLMGKVIGIAGVGLTQILIWIVLGLVISSGASMLLGPELASSAGGAAVSQPEVAEQMANSGMGQNKVLQALSTINFPLVIGVFVFYFLFGYLTYAALFGAIGAAVDSETDSQQFMLPVTVPMIIAIVSSSAIIEDPEGTIAVALSLFPLTAPVVMMIRVPFIGASWQLFASMGILVLTFLLVTWLAGRIYRVGILMYGKKPTWKELSKWLFYKA